MRGGQGAGAVKVKLSLTLEVPYQVPTRHEMFETTAETCAAALLCAIEGRV